MWPASWKEIRVMLTIPIDDKAKQLYLRFNAVSLPLLEKQYPAAPQGYLTLREVISITVKL